MQSDLKSTNTGGSVLRVAIAIEQLGQGGSNA